MIIPYLFFTSYLFGASIIQDSYFVESNDIYITTLIEDAPKELLLYKIQPHRYTKKVSSKDLLNKLKEFGYENYIIQGRYVKFTKKSPIDTSKIVSFLKQHYKNSYKNITINKVTLHPRGYIKTLPKNYTIEIKKKNHLKKDGILNIKTAQNQKLFFNYTIDATLHIYKTDRLLKRHTELSNTNISGQSIKLDRFMAHPIQEIKENTLQVKRQIKKGKILTLRDVEILSLVKKNSSINISLRSKNLSITFTAKALQNGKLGEIITIQKSNRKRLKAKVTGRDRAEVQ